MRMLNNLRPVTEFMYTHTLSPKHEITYEREREFECCLGERGHKEQKELKELPKQVEIEEVNWTELN